jgi:hypothetical protein
MAATAQSFQFTRASLTKVNLIIGLAGGTGSGKTYSAMKMASGIAGGKPFAVIDTERGRAKHYAREFVFDHCDIDAPFRPEKYARAIIAADDAGYPVIVVDSMSHEWAGEGGILDWQEEELDRMAGDDWKKRESCKMAAWIKPKMDHKKMVQRLLQVRAHLILCFRAEEKVEMVKGDDGKMKIVPKTTLTGLDGWVPICEKSLPYELTASFLLTADAPGVPKPIKLQQQHRAMFPLGKPIDEAAGQRIAAWAAGDTGTPSFSLSISDYNSCTSLIAFEALEKRRGEVWKAMRPGPEKEALKAAADAARQRLSSPERTDDQWIASFRGATDLVALETLWSECIDAHARAKREIALPVEDAFKIRSEVLKQK